MELTLGDVASGGGGGWGGGHGDGETELFFSRYIFLVVGDFKRLKDCGTPRWSEWSQGTMWVHL